MRRFGKRHKFFIKLAALLVITAVALVLAGRKKDVLVREGGRFVQGLLSRETRLDVRIGRISGRPSGSLRFEDVRLEDPALPAGLRLIFHAKEMEFHYRLLDFLAKKFDSKVHVSVRGAELYWRPKVSMRRDPLGVFGWMRDLAVAKRDRLSVSVEDLKLVYGVESHEIAGIQLGFENDAFSVRLPVRHWEIWGQDVSTQLDVRGKFRSGLLQEPDALTGEVSTQGTVINWTPLSWESKFDFTLTGDGIRLHSSDFLGGLDVDAGIDLGNDNALDVAVTAHQYDLGNIMRFWRTASPEWLEAKLDLEARLKGPLEGLNLEAYVRLTEEPSARHFKALDLHVSGVYPTLQLSDSHVVLEDGSMMRFADKIVEFKDLFSGELYQDLISGVDQDTVVMGDWEFKRPVDENQRPEFRMQRSLGEKASVHFKKFDEPSEEKLDSPDDHNMELGFEYRLKGKDSLKFQMNEDEGFIGIERKTSF